MEPQGAGGLDLVAAAGRENLGDGRALGGGDGINVVGAGLW